jgi:hypothetical protein
MTKQQLIENVSNNAKFSSFEVYKTDNGYDEIGFRFSRKNSYTFFWFKAYDDLVCFSHSYSQTTGKTCYNYKKVRNLLWSIGYFG